MGMLRAGSFPKPRNVDKREREKKGGAQGKEKERKIELRPVWEFKGRREKKSCGRRQKRGDRRERKKEQRQGQAFKGGGKRSVAGGRREEKKGGGRRGSG